MSATKSGGFAEGEQPAVSFSERCGQLRGAELIGADESFISAPPAERRGTDPPQCRQLVNGCSGIVLARRRSAVELFTRLSSNIGARILKIMHLLMISPTCL